MKIEISEFGSKLSWEYSNRIIHKGYNSRIMSYEVLPDKGGVLILEPYLESGSNNAVIYHLDGSEYWRLPYTDKTGEGQCFDRSGFKNGELTVFAIIQNRDIRINVDWKERKYISVFSAR